MSTIPAVYKQTEVGVNPEDWEDASLGDVTEIRVGRDMIEDRFSQEVDSRFRFPVFSNAVSNKMRCSQSSTSSSPRSATSNRPPCSSFSPARAACRGLGESGMKNQLPASRRLSLRALPRQLMVSTGRTTAFSFLEASVFPLMDLTLRSQCSYLKRPTRH